MGLIHMSVSYFNNAKKVVDQIKAGEWHVIDMHDDGGIFRCRNKTRAGRIRK